MDCCFKSFAILLPMQSHNRKKQDLCSYMTAWPKNYIKMQCSFMQLNFQDYASQGVYWAAVLDFKRPMHAV